LGDPLKGNLLLFCKPLHLEAQQVSTRIEVRRHHVSKSIHQLCISITEAAEEENNHTGNKEVDMQVNKLRSNGKKEKEKVHVLAGEWRMIMTAINRGTDVPVDSRREVLIGYKYALHQRRKKAREERDMFMRSRDDDSISSEEQWVSTVTHQKAAWRGTKTRSIKEGQQCV
jgi:hypothetical protein